MLENMEKIKSGKEIPQIQEKPKVKMKNIFYCF